MRTTPARRRDPIKPGHPGQPRSRALLLAAREAIERLEGLVDASEPGDYPTGSQTFEKDANALRKLRRALRRFE